MQNFILLLISNYLVGQTFYRGADLSYVNEMQDCGVVYKKESKAIDPYALLHKRAASL
ncbi:MAG: hypothetical protein IPH94_21685 [Saprospiraceae bacterium]|nr:hypothetical protein [Saprospiraceae bacterium]